MVLLASTAAIAFSAGACSGDTSTATLPPAPSGSAGGEITDTPTAAKPGEIFDFGGLRVKVSGVVDPLESSESSYVPLPDNRFVGVTFEVVNPGGSPKAFSPASEASLVDQEGQQYQMLLGQRQDDLTGQEIAPGVTISGRIAFELPNGRKPQILELRRAGIRGADIKLGGA